MKYSQITYADMSKAAYDTGRKRDIKGFRIDEQLSSPDYVTYVNNTDGHVVIAFRGTSRIDRGDLGADVMVAAGDQGSSWRFMQARMAVRAAKSKYGNNDVEVTGHSLGGSEAMFVSSKEKVPAMTFNAGVSPVAAFFDHQDYSRVTAIYDQRDIISSGTQSIPGSTGITRINSTNGEPSSSTDPQGGPPSGNVDPNQGPPSSVPPNSNPNSNPITNPSAAVPAPPTGDKSGGSSGTPAVPVPPPGVPPPPQKKRGFWKTLGHNLKQDAQNVNAGLKVIGTDIAKHPFESVAIGVGILAAGALTGGAAFGLLGEAAGEYVAVATTEAVADTVVDTAITEATPLLENAVATATDEATVNLPYYGSQYVATAAPEGTATLAPGAANYVGAGLGAAGVAAGTGVGIAGGVLGKRALQAAGNAHSIKDVPAPPPPDVPPAAPSDPGTSYTPGQDGNPATQTYQPPGQTTTTMVPELDKNGKPTGKMVKKTTTTYPGASSSTYYAPQYDLTGGLSHTTSRHLIQNATHYHKRRHSKHHRRHHTVKA